MADNSEDKPVSIGGSGDEFFNVGPPLHAVRPGYISRAADDLLFETVVTGHYAHVIAPDRTGKSSLIAATSARLQNNGVRVAVLDLAQIAERDGGTDAGRWYYSIAYRLLRQLRIKVDLQTWWQDKAILSHRQRLFEFYVEVVLHSITDPVVVFIDEIQHIADLPFDEHLLASIRAANNARTTEPDFSRLVFVLIGECDPQSLVADQFSSPFAISQEIILGDFSRDDLDIFANELNLSPTDAELALDRIYFWTGGQPYLSQKLARAVSRETSDGDVNAHVDKLAIQQLAGRSATSSEPHMSHIHRVALEDRRNREALLTLYGQIRKGIEIEYDAESGLHRRLRAIGLVVVDSANVLRVRNRIYETVFTARWANENLPMHWRGPAIAVALLLALIAIPFSYTQLLPKPYLNIMSAPATDLSAVADAYVNLRSFPGHADAADRMFRTVLESRAREAGSRSEIQAIVRNAALLTNDQQFARELRASFWDRQANQALRREQRDDALLASLEALVLPTQERRRRAASLVGVDYSLLHATVPASAADGVVFDQEALQLSYYRGAEINQWAVGEDGLIRKDPWTMSALEISPLLRRVIVDLQGTASRVGLTINVSHARLDDLLVRLISPSGRTAAFVFDVPASAANEDIRIPQEFLAPMIGEELNGTWTLSIRDEATGVTGHLVSWNLSLNSQVVVESFERGLDIPDPVERSSENLWFAPDGRYAISRAIQSDSARLWDLRYATALRTFAVPAAERVLGLTANAEFLATLTGDAVNLWRSSDGRRQETIPTGNAGTDAILSQDGRFILVPTRGDVDSAITLWSVTDREPLATLDLAGAPALIAVDASATRIAVADYDRAVRIWDVRSGNLVSQIDLDSQATEIALSANGAALGVVYGGQGVSLWLTESPEMPILQQWSRNEWHMTFSASGDRFLAGNHAEGFQAFRSSDGTPSGPLLDAQLTPGTGHLFAFSADEQFVVTAAANGIARFWSVPPIARVAAEAAAGAAGPGHQIWRESGELIGALAPGGERIAVGDNAGHVHIKQVTSDSGIENVEEEISFLGHRTAVAAVVFSDDGSLVASADTDGSVRVWDSHSGLPRPFYGDTSLTPVSRMAFSPSGNTLAVLAGQHIWLMDAESGAISADIALGEVTTAIAFANDAQIYLGSDNGILQTLNVDRTGNWTLRSIWQGTEPLRGIAVSPQRQLIVIVDAQNHARLFDPVDGGIGGAVLEIPGDVRDIAFSPSESRVAFRTARWVHRALVTPGGLLWTDTIRAPKALAGSSMVFDAVSAAPDTDRHISDPSGDKVLILTRDSGFAELAELYFSYQAGPTVFGNRTGLVAEWAEKLDGPSLSGFAREGF